MAETAQGKMSLFLNGWNAMFNPCVGFGGVARCILMGEPHICTQWGAPQIIVLDSPQLSHTQDEVFIISRQTDGLLAKECEVRTDRSVMER